MYLLTGSSGVIGRELVRHWESLEVPYFSLPKNYLLEENSALLNDVFVNLNIHHIVHLAAVVPNFIDVSDCEEFSIITRSIDSRILNISRKWQIPVTYLSGCSIYDNSKSYLKVETSPFVQNPTSPYLFAKKIGDMLYQNSPQTQILRLSAPISPVIPQSTLVMYLLNQLKDSGCIEISGQGQREQDYVDVRDIAEAITQLSEKPYFGVFNICNSKPITALALAKMMISTYGSGSIHIRGGLEHPRYARYSNVKILETGWLPKIPLEKSLEEVCQKNDNS